MNEIEKTVCYFKKNDDSLQLEAAYFLQQHIGGHYSADTSFLVKYRPILFRFNSLLAYKESHPSFPLTKTIDSLWKELKNQNSNYDLSTYSLQEDSKLVTSKYLINEIKISFKAWRLSPYHDSVSFDTFCEYILPYRRQENLPIENWRPHFFKKLFNRVCKIYPSPIRSVVDSILYEYKNYSHTYNMMPDYPYLKVKDFEISKRADCATKCWFNSMLFASIGIPVAVDRIPAWGNRNGQHQWNVVIDKNGSHPFESFWEDNKWKYNILYNNLSTDSSFGDFRLPKVFRFTYSSNPDLIKLNETVKKMDIPPFFKSTKYKDVSAQYFKTTDVIIDIKKPGKAIYAYLCVFNNGTWVPVQYGQIKKKQVIFRKMGRDIIYLPALYINNIVHPIDDAFFINPIGNIEKFIVNHKKTNLTLDRKFPIYPYKHEWARTFIGAKIQGSNNSKFKNAEDLLVFKNELNLSPAVLSLKKAKKHRYIRLLYQGNQRGNLAELMFLSNTDNTRKQVKGNVIFSNELNKLSVISAFDNDLRTYIPPFIAGIKKYKSQWWLGIDFATPTRIDAIIICPRNDGNSIIRKKTYELFYWNYKWISLGRKVANADTLTFRAPLNTIYLLKDQGGGKENRIFFLKNEKIIWK